MAERAATVPADDRSDSEKTKHGYLFWGPVVGAILLTESLGAAGGWLEKKLGITIPWPTISTTVGHLEDRWPAVGAAVVGLIAASALLALSDGRRPERKTAYGRTLMRGGDQPTPIPFYTAWISILPAAVAGFVARIFTDDKLTLGYAIYGAFAVYGILLPSLLVFFKREVQFPTLFFTIRRLREHIPMVATALVAGLAILGVHLAFYPWPDITREPTQFAGLDARHAKTKAQQKMAELRAGKEPLKYSTQARGIDNGKDAWLVFFTAPKDAAGTYGGCVVAVRNDTARPSPGCSE